MFETRSVHGVAACYTPVENLEVRNEQKTCPTCSANSKTTRDGVEPERPETDSIQGCRAAPARCAAARTGSTQCCETRPAQTSHRHCSGPKRMVGDSGSKRAAGSKESGKEGAKAGCSYTDCR